MSDEKHAPRLPDVVDEAGNSPAWVPLLGLGLLCLVALFVAAREALGHDDQKPAAVAADAGTPEPSPAEKKPAGGEAKP